MQEHGFDESKPIDVWAENTVFDGFTRLDCALDLGLETVPVYQHHFDSEEAVKEQAIHNQCARRNLTQQELLRFIPIVDRPKPHGGNRVKSKGPNEPLERSAEETARKLGTSPNTVKRARQVLDDPEATEDVMSGRKSISAGAKDATERKKATTSITTQKFNRVNENIEWARWSWNPVTGCEHACEYCYARDIAERFYKEKFKPTFRPERLKAPGNMTRPKTDAIGETNVFVCSMADLFGKWVPAEWIQCVLDVCAKHVEWNFLFLTKFPQRYLEFTFTDNCWLGTSVDTQAKVACAERTFEKIPQDKIRWLSCEPMMERLTFKRLDMFDWIVIGGASKSTKTPAFIPPYEWFEHLNMQAKAAGCKRYHKTNLGYQVDSCRAREYPGDGGEPS